MYKYNIYYYPSPPPPTPLVIIFYSTIPFVVLSTSGKADVIAFNFVSVRDAEDVPGTGQEGTMIIVESESPLESSSIASDCATFLCFLAMYLPGSLLPILVGCAKLWR